jgi:prepilin peptidase CpaA
MAGVAALEKLKVRPTQGDIRMGSLLVVGVFPALAAYAAASDLLTMTIPNRLSLALVVGFPASAVAVGLPLSQIGMHAAAGGLVLAIGIGLFALGWIGGGDAKFAAAVALWFGFTPLLDYVTVSAMMGGALTLLILFARKLPLPAFVLDWHWLTRLHDPKVGIPYGIALSAAALFMFPRTPIWQSLTS